MPSILTCKPLPGRGAEFGSAKEQRLRRSWQVTTDSRYQSEASFLQAAVLFGGGTVPIPYVSTHPDDAKFLCKRLRGDQDRAAPLRWIVSADYDTAPVDKNREEETKVPTERRAKIVWNTVKYQKAIERDRDGYAILNAAGDYFDPPPIKDVSRWTVTVTKNMTFIPTSILSWRDKLNSDTFTIDGIEIAPNVARIMAIQIGDFQKDGDDEYRVLSYTLEFDDTDKWRGKYLNQGFYQVVASVKSRIKIDGKDCVTPQILDSTGALNASPTPANSWFMTYLPYSEMVYSGNLPLA